MAFALARPLRKGHTVAFWPHSATPTPKIGGRARGNMSSQILCKIQEPIYLGLQEDEKKLDFFGKWVDNGEMIVECPEGFVDFTRAESMSGVYLLWLEGKVVYAGKSKNICSRIADHQKAMRRGRPLNGKYNGMRLSIANSFKFDQVMVKYCPPEDLDVEEIALIQRYRPNYNRQLNRGIPPEALSKLACYQELLGKATVYENSAKEIENARKVLRRQARTLPPIARRAEATFRQNRDKREKITLPKLKCLEAEVA